jgi:predicted kinase
MIVDLKKPMALIMCGPPASGKSTFIKTQVPPDFNILSRDKIRDHFYGKKYKPNKKAEDTVTSYYNEILGKILELGVDVVVDKTNCNEFHFKNEIKLFEEKNYTIVLKFFDVPLRILIFREIKRRFTDRSKPSVPFKVIRDMKRRYDKIKKTDYAKYILY